MLTATLNKQTSNIIETNLIKPKPTVIELFAGAGGLALGFEQAGFHHVLLNENDKHCCAALKINRPSCWPVLDVDITAIDFTSYKHKSDVVTGGFPCQAFSIAGKKRGFADKRGALFFEFARAVVEIQPKLFIAENVKGLLFHEKGKTLKLMLQILANAGYKLLQPQVLKAIHYQVPQKRERLFIVGIREDIVTSFYFPLPDTTVYTLSDALKAGRLYHCDVPASKGEKYSVSKAMILSQVPAGGCWRDLPVEIQKAYLGKFYGKGSNSQVARRLSWQVPCYTLLTAPQSKLTERCHPDETRPLTIREYARIQTFPDEWQFMGSLTSQYRQIGNAVPVNLATTVATAINQVLF